MKSLLDKVNAKLNAQGGLLKSVGLLVGGTAGAQLLLIAATPFLTRLYSPSDFGILAAFVALLAFFTVVANGRYELAIHLPEKIEDTVAITVLAFLCLLFTTFIVIVSTIFLSQPIANLLNAPQLASYLWLLPLAVFFVGLYQICNAWYVRQKQYKDIAGTKVLQSILTLLIQLSTFKLAAFGLMLGQTLGQGAGSIKLSLKSIKNTKEFWSVQFHQIKTVAKRYKSFPIYSTWTGLFNTASLQLAPLVFLSLFGATVAGLYALTLKLVSLPISLIGQAIGSVFLSEAPKAQREGRLNTLVLQFNKKLVQLGCLPTAILIVFGPELFVFVLGEQWYKAGEYAQWLAPWIFLQFQWTPLSNLTVVLELQKEALISQLLTFFARFGALFYAIGAGMAADHAIQLFAVISALVYFVRMFWFLNVARVNIKQIFFDNIIYILPSILVLITLKLIFF
ncbi:oligosaccharide flippase family protein [Acinetobacter variabilis]|uniref:oligosaccharide flippase family protein n=1 Tax=Acinetobacter variabilis TaxID=70346 RepID=UPI0021D0D374|nr:oligosaccharide flippase family protein [Acinetobacter variabilis]MCU4311799.1 oligosaccharide flippase family protein [Acinetobacter variabilis]